MKREKAEAAKAWRLIWATYGQLPGWWVAMIFSALVRISNMILMPIFSSLMLGSMAVGDFERAWYFVLAFAGASLLYGITYPAGYYFAVKAEHKGFRKLVNEYFYKLVNTDVNYFSDNKTGYLVAQARGFGDATLRLVRKLRRDLMRTVIMIVVPIIVIMTQNLLIGSVILVLSLGLLLYSKWAANNLQPIREQAREVLRENTGIISDIITNIIAIRASAREKTMYERMEKRWDLEIKKFIRRHFLAIRLMIGRDLIGFVFFVVSASLVVWQGSMGAISFTLAILIMQYLMTIAVGCSSLNDDLEDIAEEINQIQPAAEFMERENKITDRPGAKTLRKVKGAIELENVVMGYEGCRLFSGLSLKIAPGEKLGVVGVSGAGKTTLVKLIMRFDDVESGKVMIDGHDVRELKQDSLHKNIAYVPQEPLLMHDTITENIRLGRPNATNKEIEAAVRAAHLTDLIRTLPNGLETVVGERGIKLSGGQKQRVAIARAMLQGAPIMILDEATSALDSESEAIIKDSFKNIFRGKTAVVVAHRLSTLRDMDRIIVVAEGKIVEAGSHLSLVRQNGVYAKMWKKQSEFE
ncbi:ABC transporter ATP-binding protein/permease [Candidatus Saccharibacteria bacterium]|nr:ABC transporter ATP-binding protein/permease [Candidatus Saccharibacteria bacterium]